MTSRRAWLTAAALACVLAPPARAQRADSVRAGVSAPRRPARATAPDTVAKPPVSPRRAFLYSGMLPGLGQAKLQRYNAGALFVGIEMASFAMAIKSRADLQQAKQLYRDSVVVSYGAPDSTGAPTPTFQSCRSTTDATVREAQRVCPITQDRVRARRVHYEDWIAALIFNHLFSGADAFVAAQLWDLPTQVSAHPADGGVTVAARVTW